MSARKPRAVVIEDERDILDLLTAHLRRLGYEVDGAFSGERGLELAVANPPDLVLVDMMLPGMDGREVIRRLRSDERTRHCSVIVCSVLDEEGLTDSGADAVLAKPFVRSAVTRIVTAVTSQGGS